MPFASLWIASALQSHNKGFKPHSKGSSSASKRQFASTTTLTSTQVAVIETLPPPPPAAAAASKPVSDVVAGATARAASQATIHPLDTLKVRIQANISKKVVIKGIGKQLTLSKIRRSVGSLYKGIFSAASGAGIAIGAYFAFYSVAKNMLTMKTNLGPGPVAFISGGAAAAGSSVVKVPIAVCIRSVQAGVYSNVFSAARQICSTAGPQALFTGYFPTLLEDVPDMAVKFAVYETLRSFHRTMIGNRNATAQEDFVMGAAAGAAAAAFTTPLDAIKTNMMCIASKRPNMFTVSQKIIVEQGVNGFFKGIGPRVLSNAINSAVFFCFFEGIRSIINENRKNSKFSEKNITVTVEENRNA